MATSNDVFKLTVTAQGQGSLYQNTYAFRVLTEIVYTQALWDAVGVACKDLYRTIQSNTITYRSWRAIQVRGENVRYDLEPCKRSGGVVFEANYSSNTTGMIAGDMLPPQAASVITVNTGQIGRTHRGRLYGFGHVEADQAAGIWGGSYLTAQAALILAFHNKYIATTGSPDPNFDFGVWSDRTAFNCSVDNQGNHVSHGAPNPSQAFTKSTGMVLRSTVFTQRRRTVGVGR